MTRQTEYDDNLVAMLELVWGEGYMAPGGAGNIDRLLRGLATDGRRVLDIGCGLGGPAVEMARSHGAEVVGIDLEPPLIERARHAAARYDVTDRCSFLAVEPGPLPFADATFDIVISSGAVTQTGETAALFAEAYRVLRPGGHVRCYEWMRTERELSDEMIDWLRLEGLTYALRTLDEYQRMLQEAGFAEVEVEDATDWYREEAHRELDAMRGELYPRMVDALGTQGADHFIANWQAMVVVIDSGEMRQGYLRGRRPG